MYTPVMQEYKLYHVIKNLRERSGMKHRFFFAILMSFVLTFFMSAWVTFINVGLIDGFINYWMSAWLLAWPAAGVISFASGPRVHSIAHQIADKL